MIRIVPVFLFVIVGNLWVMSFPPFANEPVTTARLLANLTLMPRVFGYECLDPVMWTLQVEMMFYSTLVVLYKIGALRRYFIGWGTLLLLSLMICPTLDALQASHAQTLWFGSATAIRRLMLLDFVPLFAIGFLLYMIKTDVGKKWQNILGMIAAAFVFHSIDHGKHNPLATVLIIGLVTASAYGRVPILRFRPLVFVSTISYALYLFHNNLGCILIHRFDTAGMPPRLCFVIALVFSFCLSTVVTLRVEQPITNRLRKAWQDYRSGRQPETATAPA